MDQEHLSSEEPRDRVRRRLLKVGIYVVPNLLSLTVFLEQGESQKPPSDVVLTAIRIVPITRIRIRPRVRVTIPVRVRPRVRIRIRTRVEIVLRTRVRIE